MVERHYILLPVKVGFMIASLAAAAAWNLLPWQDVRGVPDLLALVIAFWSVHQPRKLGIGTAWLLGLLMDTANGVLIGQHALAYAALAYACLGLHRRILQFTQLQQALHMLVLLVGCQFVMLAVRMLAGGTFPGLWYFAGGVISAALWPLATLLLLAPQRLPAEVDETRPI